MVRFPAFFFALLLCGLCVACAPRAPETTDPRPTRPAPVHLSPAQRLDAQFRAARPLLALIEALPPRADFADLRRALERNAAGRKGLKAALDWVALHEQNPQALTEAFGLPWKPPETAPEELTRTESGELLPPAQASMWAHCQKAFATQRGGTARLETGYMSAARQVWLMARNHADLASAFQHWGPPGGSGFQGRWPLMAITLERGSPNDLHRLCAPLGLLPQGPHLRFIGPQALYAATFDKLDPQLAEPLEAALHRARFFPSPQGLKVILAMGFKESSLQWDPALTKPKREALRASFLETFSTTESGWGAALTQMVLPQRLLRQKQELSKRLHRLLDRRSTEYEFYRWTRSANAFLHDLLAQYGQLAQLGSQVLDLEQKLRRLEYEPQTFGLFQLNVNHLAEKLSHDRHLSRRFPGLLPGGRVDRDGLVRALSGLEEAPLSRTETLELIFRAELAPRYADHLQGHPADLYYFAAENLTGPLSTYKAALQQELSQKLGRKLVLDGDLSFYRPYSRQIDPKRRSNSQTALLRFASAQRHLTEPRREVSRLLSASRYPRLASAPLYGLIMGQQAGARIYPEVQSELYSQSPQGYALKVLQLASRY